MESFILATTKQTAFRLPPLLLDKLKEAARQESLSVNEYVRRTLEEATQDVETAAERAERIRRTEAFLSTFYGKWASAPGEADLMDTISGGRTTNTPIDL